MQWHVCRHLKFPPNTCKAFAEGDPDFVGYVEDLNQRPFHEVQDVQDARGLPSNTLVVPVAQNFPTVDAFTMDGNLYQVIIDGLKILLCNRLDHSLLTSMFGNVNKHISQFCWLPTVVLHVMIYTVKQSLLTSYFRMWLQFTVSSSHSLNVEGLLKVLEVLPLGTKPRYFGCVPNLRTFNKWYAFKEMLLDTKASGKAKQLLSELQQYVMLLPVPARDMSLVQAALVPQQLTQAERLQRMKVCYITCQLVLFTLPSGAHELALLCS